MLLHRPPSSTHTRLPRLPLPHIAIRNVNVAPRLSAREKTVLPLLPTYRMEIITPAGDRTGAKSLTISSQFPFLPSPSSSLAAGRRSPLLRRRVHAPTALARRPPSSPPPRSSNPIRIRPRRNTRLPLLPSRAKKRKKENGGGSRVAEREGRRPRDAGDPEVSPAQAFLRLQPAPALRFSSRFCLALPCLPIAVQGRGAEAARLLRRARPHHRDLPHLRYAPPSAPPARLITSYLPVFHQTRNESTTGFRCCVAVACRRTTAA
jgi:hypothetical protein